MGPAQNQQMQNQQMQNQLMQNQLMQNQLMQNQQMSGGLSMQTQQPDLASLLGGCGACGGGSTTAYEPQPKRLKPDGTPDLWQDACWYHARGNCHKGQTCKFSHDDQLCTSALLTEPDGQAMKTKMCSYLSWPGGCKF